MKNPIRAQRGEARGRTPRAFVRVGAATLTTALAVGVGGGLVAAPAANAAHSSGYFGYGDYYTMPVVGKVYIGSLKAVESNEYGWCVDWTTDNVRGVKATSSTKLSSNNAAVANWVIQNHKDTPEDFPEIAMAVHELLDPTDNASNGWGQAKKSTDSSFKADFKRAKGYIAEAKKYAGSYKIKPVLKTSADLNSIALTGTSIVAKSGTTFKSFNGKAVKVTLKITGNATFSNGSKTLTANAGANQKLKVTGTGAVSVKATSAKVLPASTVLRYNYSGKSQNKVVTGGLDDAAGSAKVTVPVPSIGTTATNNANGAKSIALTSATVAVPAKIKDVVAYKNLPTGTYALSGTLMDKTTKKSTGVKASTTFKNTSVNGTAAIVFSIPDARKYAGKSLVAFEVVKEGTKTVATHQDINSSAQTVTVGTLPNLPSIGTTATDNADGDKALSIPVSNAVTPAKIKDVVAYKNLPAGAHTLTATLMDKSTGKSTGITGTAKFTNTAKTGKATVTLSIPDVRKYAGKSLVVFEVLKKGNTTVATHQDINDKGQTVTVSPMPPTPVIGTTAQSLINGTLDDDKQLDYVYGDATYGEARWVAPVEILDSQSLGNITGLTKTNDNNEIVMDDTVAEVVDADKGIFKDNDGKLVNVNGYFVDPDGNLVLAKTQGYWERDGSSKVTAEARDKVDYSKMNGYVGQSGTLKATIMDKATGKDVTNALTGKASIDSTQKVAAASGSWLTPIINVNMGTRALNQRFIPEDQSGNTPADWNSESVTTVNDDSKVITKTSYVFFEDFIIGGTTVASHHDIKSTSQTFSASNPQMGTIAADAADGDKVIDFDGGYINDTVTASGLSIDGLRKEGNTFRLDASMYDHSTQAEDPEIAASMKVDPLDQKFNTWTIKLEVPKGFDGRNLTVYERLVAIDKDGKETVVIDHTNPDSTNQTVTVEERPGIATLAAVTSDGSKYLKQSGDTVTDTVIWSKARVGTEYNTKATLLKANSQEPIEIDGKQITGTSTFTADTADGQTAGASSTTFDLNADVIKALLEQGIDTVSIRQDLYEGDRLIQSHNVDGDDPAETLTISKIGTVATDANDGDKYVGLDSELKDTIEYTNVYPGKEVTVTGTAVIHKEGTETTITKTETFTPEEPNGTYEMNFGKVPAEYVGTALTFYETFADVDMKIIAEHKNPNDEEQTVYVSKIGTLATDAKDGDKFIGLDSELQDEIEYENLATGVEVTVTGLAVIYENGEPTTITKTEKFTPETADGVFTMNFGKVPAEYLGKDLTFFETVTDSEGRLIAEHKDPTDKKQTVHISKIGTLATDAEDGDKIVASEGGSAIDEIALTNFAKGDYVAESQWYDKNTCKPIGEPVKSDFTVEKDGNSTTKIEMTVPANTTGSPWNIVAFEKVYDKSGKLIAVHEDCNSQEQTIVVEKPEVPPTTPPTTPPGTPPLVKTGADAGLLWGGFAGIALLAAGSIMIARRRKQEPISTDQSAE